VPAANVLAYDPTNRSKKITINVGSDSGVEIGQAVVSGNGVVGQVIAVNAKTAQVMLITDPSSGVDALVQRSRTRAVLDGTGGNRCRLMFSSTNDDLKNGDRIVTSGLDGVFPKGLSLGVAIHVGSDDGSEKGMLFRGNVWIQPSVDFNRLETVMVVTAS
jgi:rod shape-determining protein MreC